MPKRPASPVPLSQRKPPTAVIAIALLLGACSPNDPDTTSQPAPTAETGHNVIAEPLQQALDKAEGVEQVLQDGAAQRERAMQAQGL